MPSIHVRDTTLYYETAGSGPPVLLLHGLGSSTRDWQLQVPVFAQTYEVVMVDVRGHGRSAKPRGPYSVPQFTADVVAFMEALHIAPVHMLGLSMGGMIAFQTAVDHPDLLRSMVIVNSYPELVPHSLSDYLTWYRRHAIVQLMGMKRMGQYLGKTLFPEPHQIELRQMIAQRWTENDKRAYMASTRALFGWSMAAHLGDIRCPTLIIAADMDYTPVAQKEAYTAKIPGARLVVIPNSRHATPIDQPELFNQTVLAFWEEIGGGIRD
ncbi:MAG: alpha/beta fold hydrolase [Ardenticatenaceae bacterium]|nr:alpha/beta fold hydrolase [Anaerolineales bacterium]MCB8923555.1 alpha/beta fold hydrolase [Ardenticatenaceae bacterium]MCB8991703.1 alpha/beta fold hydrolase [Ardenticatenaceae bacterium]